MVSIFIIHVSLFTESPACVTTDMATMDIAEGKVEDKMSECLIDR